MQKDIQLHPADKWHSRTVPPVPQNVSPRNQAFGTATVLKSGGNALSINARKMGLTFNADNMIPDLLAQDRVLDRFNEVVDGIDGRVDTLKALDLLPDGHRVA